MNNTSFALSPLTIAVLPLAQNHSSPPMMQSSSIVSVSVQTARDIGISLLANVALLDALDTLDATDTPTGRISRNHHRMGLDIAIKKNISLIERIFFGYVKLPDDLVAHSNTLQQMHTQRMEAMHYRAALRQQRLNPYSR